MSGDDWLDWSAQQWPDPHPKPQVTPCADCGELHMRLPAQHCFACERGRLERGEQA